MKKPFVYFRISLLENKQAGLFEDKDDVDRRQFLLRAFGSDFQFAYLSNVLTYVHEGEIDSFIVGRVGREIPRVEHDPKNKYQEITRNVGQAAYIIIDPNDHEYGQIIAFEASSPVGSPNKIVLAICANINSTLNTRFSIFVEQIFDVETFWDFASENKGNIVSIKFEFNAPNQLFGSDDDFEEEMRQLRDHTLMQQAKIELKSKDGLNTDATEIKNGVKYAQIGRGKISARTSDRKRYSSDNNAKKSNVVIDINDDKKVYYSLVDQIRRFLSGEPRD